MQVHGEHESVVIALFSTGTISAKEFKRKFPREFEKIKGYTNGADFTQKMIDNIVNDLGGIDWDIQKDKYTGLNIDIDEAENYINKFSEENRDKIRSLIEKETEKDDIEEDMIIMSVGKSGFNREERDFSEQMHDNSNVSGHPVSKNPKKYAIGWIRYTKENNIITITEVQSDLLAAKNMAQSPIYRKEGRRMGLNDHYFDEIIRMCDSMQRYTERVYEDSIAMIFLLAAKEGMSVEMLTSKDKEDSPIHVYEDLPKSMGMIKGNSDIEGRKVWKYQPPHLS